MTVSRAEPDDPEVGQRWRHHIDPGDSWIDYIIEETDGVTALLRAMKSGAPGYVDVDELLSAKQ